MKPAIILLFALLFLFGTKAQNPEKEKWFFFSHVNFDNSANCTRKIEVVLDAPFGKYVNLNTIQNAQIKIDSFSVIYILVDGDTAGTLYLLSSCHSFMKSYPIIIDINLRGNCRDCFKLENCFKDRLVGYLTKRETTSTEDTLLELGQMQDLCATENDIRVFMRIGQYSPNLIFKEITP